ncbi:MAG: T9SS type A sorting domain-containing protein [Candidatus Marinimicrobia bacterium]|nr:T9SS type A sorting domain-containing protein [Candidatus Neomarinimicrobiota bacterium]MCF7827618.1 T9SS type A sorting domain-containing protein [Candidatus Neomarinimicrobiota bacterium]MCF7881327.1 T9SS type A sorting domain-containing protein [Candidatus Neomarinimicrobiota bacterium]
MLRQNFLRSLIINTGLLLFFPGGELVEADVTVQPENTRQTIIGFGASIAWYENLLTSHPQKDEIYEYIFDTLHLDILRIKNRYGYNQEGHLNNYAEIVDNFRYYRGDNSLVLMSSWSPPANLKSDGTINGGGTLIKTDDEYAYDVYADYWLNSFYYYENEGIFLDYISIQNEPGYVDDDWETCELGATEGSLAGYPEALDAVYTKFQDLDSPVKFIGPEVLGIGYNLFQNYANGLAANDQLYQLNGYAHHLYHGGDHKNPDSYIENMSAIAENYNDKPIFQTEFGRGDCGDWFQTAWVIHNALVYENVAAYLYWNLVWPGQGLVELDDQTYTLSKTFWAFWQYSRFIYPGWRRVNIENNIDGLKMSAFQSVEKDSLTMVILNTADYNFSMALDLGKYGVKSGEVYRTSESRDGKFLQNFGDSDFLDLPPRTITTLAIRGSMTSVKPQVQSMANKIRLWQNYPNPFNGGTQIRYSVPERGYISIRIIDISGRMVTELVGKIQSSGEYIVTWDGLDHSGRQASSGTYLYEFRMGEQIRRNKLILLR